MALADEIEGMAARLGGIAQSKREQWLAKITRYRELQRAYAACFLDEAGELSPAARVVLGDVARIAGLGVVRLNRPVDQIHFDEGQRRVVLHMLNALRLDPEVLARMARKLREQSDE